jgi:putative FmdB family regulatory protein
MPVYEYECQACGKYLEALQKISEPPLTDCPGCGQPQLRKLISAAGFRLKGSGWYETDFKGKDRKKNLHDSGDKSGGETKSDAKTDAKPDAAKPSPPETRSKATAPA